MKNFSLCNILIKLNLFVLHKKFKSHETVNIAICKLKYLHLESQSVYGATYLRSRKESIIEVPFRFRLFALNQFNISWWQDKYRPEETLSALVLIIIKDIAKETVQVK